MKVAGLQLDIAWEQPEANLSRVDGCLQEAHRAGVRLAVLPEMFATGFSMDAPRMAAYAEATREFLGMAARRYGLWLLGGYARMQAGWERPRNVCSLFDPAGQEVLCYHKVHPFSLAGEHLHYEGGNELLVHDVEGTAVCPLICYDLRFPELFRAAAAAVDLFVVIANWPESRREPWRTLLRARAIENQAFVLGVNRVGEGQDLAYSGDSCLVDPAGEVRSSGARVEQWVGGEVDPAEVRSIREKFSFLADRRPEVYRALEQGRRVGGRAS